jgi:hypothetical protein
LREGRPESTVLLEKHTIEESRFTLGHRSRRWRSPNSKITCNGADTVNAATDDFLQLASGRMLREGVEGEQTSSPRFYDATSMRADAPAFSFAAPTASPWHSDVPPTQWTPAAIPYVDVEAMQRTIAGLDNKINAVLNLLSRGNGSGDCPIGHSSKQSDIRAADPPG